MTPAGVHRPAEAAVTEPSPANALSTPVVMVKKRPAAPPKPYVPAIGPRLRILLYLVFAGFAFLAATGIYLLVISVMNRANTNQLYTTGFTFWMLIAHIAVGAVGVVPFVVFGVSHWWTARKRENRVAVRLGVVLFVLGLVVVVSGVALVQIEGLPQLPTGTSSRLVTYLAHLFVPVACVFAYIAHRRAGPAIKWQYGKYWAAAVVVVVGGMAGAHVVDPHTFGREGPAEGMRYFFPSEARTADGNFIPERALMMDEYCAKCHQDVYNDHLHSAHKFSSFNNPAYLFSVKQTRDKALERDGKMNASRWCAGCHDQVPFFSGKFDDPNFDIINDPTAHAGITCIICHSMTHVNNPIGNGAYTIEEAQHYPFAFSENRTLQWVNNQLIKAKPELHKKTFLKPFHKSAEFCSTCHKVHLPVELNHYKDFLRGQNHYDTFVLSAAGNGSRSFYFPPKGKSENCATCHMPLEPSGDFGSKDFDGSGVRKRHSHFFPGSNTGLFELLKYEDRLKGHEPALQAAIDKTADFLRGAAPDGSDKKLRIDLFGLKRAKTVSFLGVRVPVGTFDDESLTVLRPTLPTLTPGETHLVEVVIRTLNIGHPFTQGTADSNEVWVDFKASAGGKVIGRSGALSGPDETGEVDPWSHFVNVHMLDREGNRIDRRNPQDIFTPLYDKQIPPGAGQVVHYKLHVPRGVTGPVEIAVKLRYRKFDFRYMELVHKELGRPVPKLPIVDVCEDRVVLPVAGAAAGVPPQESPVKPAWQRWNDYGIGCLLEGGALNAKRGNLAQAEAAFRKLLTLGAKDAVWHGRVNLARVYLDQGRLTEAGRELNAAQACDPPAPWWLLAWFKGLVTAQNATTAADLDAAAALFETIVDPANQPRHEDGKPKYDFTKDYVVLAELGRTLYKRSTLEPPDSESERKFLLRAVAAYERALAVDPEDLDSHFGLNQCYDRLGHGAAVAARPAGPVTAERLKELGDRLAKKGESAEARLATAGQLAAAVAAYGHLRPDPQRPRLPSLRALIVQLRPAFHEETDPGVRRAVAAVLSRLHLVSHTLYTPDELARARATAIYRGRNAAANAAAEAIVLYPTNRPGAPGLAP
jgi:tetratricopeptide (TPR) repeat protein